MTTAARVASGLAADGDLNLVAGANKTGSIVMSTAGHDRLRIDKDGRILMRPTDDAAEGIAFNPDRRSLTLGGVVTVDEGGVSTTASELVLESGGDLVLSRTAQQQQGQRKSKAGDAEEGGGDPDAFVLRGDAATFSVVGRDNGGVVRLVGGTDGGAVEIDGGPGDVPGTVFVGAGAGGVTVGSAAAASVEVAGSTTTVEAFSSIAVGTATAEAVEIGRDGGTVTLRGDVLIDGTLEFAAGAAVGLPSARMEARRGAVFRIAPDGVTGGRFDDAELLDGAVDLLRAAGESWRLAGDENGAAGKRHLRYEGRTARFALLALALEDVVLAVDDGAQQGFVSVRCAVTGSAGRALLGASSRVGAEAVSISATRYVEVLPGDELEVACSVRGGVGAGGGTTLRAGRVSLSAVGL